MMRVNLYVQGRSYTILSINNLSDESYIARLFLNFLKIFLDNKGNDILMKIIKNGSTQCTINISVKKGKPKHLTLRPGILCSTSSVTLRQPKVLTSLWPMYRNYGVIVISAKDPRNIPIVVEITLDMFRSNHLVLLALSLCVMALLVAIIESGNVLEHKSLKNLGDFQRRIPHYLPAYIALYMMIAGNIILGIIGLYLNDFILLQISISALTFLLVILSLIALSHVLLTLFLRRPIKPILVIAVPLFIPVCAALSVFVPLISLYITIVSYLYINVPFRVMSTYAFQAFLLLLSVVLGGKFSLKVNETAVRFSLVIIAWLYAIFLVSVLMFYGAPILSQDGVMIKSFIVASISAFATWFIMDYGSLSESDGIPTKFSLLFSVAYLVVLSLISVPVFRSFRMADGGVLGRWVVPALAPGVVALVFYGARSALLYSETDPSKMWEDVLYYYSLDSGGNIYAGSWHYCSSSLMIYELLLLGVFV